MKGNFFKELGIKVTGIIGLTLLASSLGGLTSQAAMKGVNYVDPDKVYDEANSLIIQKEANIQNFSAKVTGSSPTKTVNPKGDTNIYKSFDKNYSSINFTFGDFPSTGISKNTIISTTHENQGTYDGRKINVIQTFSDIVTRQSPKKESAPRLEISENLFSGYYFQGITQFTYQLKFTYADTGELVDFSKGDNFLSFNSLNGGEKPSIRFESVKYLNDTDPSRVYVTKDTNIGYEIPKEYAVEEYKTGAFDDYMYGGISNDFTDYLGGSTYTKNSVQFKLTGKEQNFKIGSVESMAWNSIFSATIFNVKMPTPVKTETDTNGNDINGKTVEKNSTIIYKVHQKVNTLGVDILERYTKFEPKDPLDKNVSYQSARVTDSKGNEIKDFGTINYDKSTRIVTATASKEFLASMPLSGETYILEITTKVNSDVKNQTIIPNIGNVSINNQNEKTNEVKNTVLVPDPIDPTKKETNNKGIDYNGKAVYAGDTLIFDVSQKVHELGTDLKNPYSSFGLYDTLDHRLEYVSAVILKDGKEVKEAKDLSFDKEKNRVSFTADKNFLKSMEYKNERYTLRITTKVSTNIAEGETITNKAESLVNDITRETNEIKNPIKVPKGSIEIAKVTNQLTGIKVSVETDDKTKESKISSLPSILGINAYAEEPTDSSNKLDYNVNLSNDFSYSKKPQGGVTYELIAMKDITYGNRQMIAKAGTSFGTKTTDDKLGLAVFTDLYEGDYVAYERKAPVGIQIDPNPIFVSVRAEEGKQEFTVEQGHEDPLQEVEINGTKEFEQEDGTFKAQAGATFGLYLSDEYSIKSNEKESTESSDQATSETNTSTQSDIKSLADSTNTSESSTESDLDTSNSESKPDEEETSNTIPKDTLISEIKIGENGELSYKGVLIPNQRYYVKEIETKEGYQLLEDKLMFIYQPVNNDAVANITLYAEGYVTDGVYIPYKDVEALKLPLKDILSKSDKYKEPTEEQKKSLKNILITENSIKKSIKKADGTLVDSYNVLEDKEKITFLGVATLGNSNNPDDSIVLEDNLPKGLTYESMKIFDEKQQDITSKVKIDTKDQKVTVTINKEYAKTLKSTKLYWEVLTTYHASEDVAGKKLENEMVLNVGEKKYNSKVTLLTPKLTIKEKQTFPQTGEIVRNGAFIGLFVLAFVIVAFFLNNKKTSNKDEN